MLSIGAHINRLMAAITRTTAHIAGASRKMTASAAGHREHHRRGWRQKKSVKIYHRAGRAGGVAWRGGHGGA